jgi:hypothetical protein
MHWLYKLLIQYRFQFKPHLNQTEQECTDYCFSIEHPKNKNRTNRQSQKEQNKTEQNQNRGEQNKREKSVERPKSK